MSRKYTIKDESNCDEVEKVLTLKDEHADKLHEIRAKYGWSARRAACFVLAYTHEIETIVKTPRYLGAKPDPTKPRRKPSTRPAQPDKINLFLPMTPKQSNVADAKARETNFDFTNFFKINLNAVYADYKKNDNNLDLFKNDVTKKFIDEAMF